MFQIEEELKKLPGKPGVYIMHGEKDEIIYVGKAISLKNRVRQYFQSSRNKGAKIEQMVTHITRFEYIITDSELEALVLECNLIKEHRPKYNTMLKDDKSYPFIKVTVNEEYPRVLFARRMKKDKTKYFGPYTSAGAVKDVIELVRKLYKVRSCNRVLPRDCKKDRPCLYYHMKQCTAPCQGYITSEEYKKNITELLKFLNGDFQDTIDMLTDKMMAASDEMRFEDATEYRDLIRSIQKIGERQKITSYGEEDKDIIAVAMDESLDLREQDAVVQVFFVRDGKLIGREHFYLRVARGDTKAQVLSSFMKQFYAGTPFIPREIMLQKEIEDAQIIEEYNESISAFQRKERKRNWWNWRKRMQRWFWIRTESGSNVKKAEQLALFMRWKNGLDCRESNEWKRTIFPISVDLNPLVLWSFTKKESRNEVITVNLKSNGCRDRMIMQVWKRCLPDALPMKEKTSLTVFPSCRI